MPISRGNTSTSNPSSSLNYRDTVKKIVVASLNPVKTEAVLSGFQRLFPNETFTVEGMSVSSGVSEQPLTDAETLKGARTRAENARTSRPSADYWVGVEGGCDYLEGALVAFAWVQVLGRLSSGSARTALFRLPKKIQDLVEKGYELGEADDLVFGRTNSKQESGAVGLLSGDVITRKTYYEQAVILALFPFKNQDLYS